MNQLRYIARKMNLFGKQKRQPGLGVLIVLGVLFQIFQFWRNQSTVYTGLSATDAVAAVADAPPEPTPAQQATTHSGQVQLQVNVKKALADSGILKKGPKPTLPPSDPGFDKFNYSQPAIPNEMYTLPPPRKSNQSTIVITLSSRDHFERRAAIRDTWAKGNDNVYFVIGGPVPGDTADIDRENPLSTSSMLFWEQQHFGDIIDAIHPDMYSGLPYKLHFGMRWVMQNLDNVDWIVKADDDVVVRVKLLQYFVLRKLNPNHPQVIGSVVTGGRPHRSGKWEEDPHFTGDEYPPWAFGSSGYVVSRPVARYVADHEHYYYQGEDAGLGIWLDQSPLQVTWTDTPELRKDEGCLDKLYIIGHDLTIAAIRKCFEALGDEIPHRDYIVAFSAGRKDQFSSRIRNPN